LRDGATVGRAALGVGLGVAEGDGSTGVGEAAGTGGAGVLAVAAGARAAADSARKLLTTPCARATTATVSTVTIDATRTAANAYLRQTGVDAGKPPSMTLPRCRPRAYRGRRRQRSCSAASGVFHHPAPPRGVDDRATGRIEG